MALDVAAIESVIEDELRVVRTDIPPLWANICLPVMSSGFAVAVQIGQDHGVDGGILGFDPVLDESALAAFHLLLEPGQAVAVVRANDHIVQAIAVHVSNQDRQSGARAAATARLSAVGCLTGCRARRRHIGLPLPVRVPDPRVFGGMRR